jgi:23S rRNA pseudouridine1911/1915/1917 synthase
MSLSATTYTLTVDADKAGARLDRFLAAALPELSRSRLQALVASGNVASGCGRPVTDVSLRVRAGATYAVVVPPTRSDAPEPQAIDLNVVFEDEHLLVVDKPAGLVVHPGAGNYDRTLVNALLAHTGGALSSIGAPLRPGIIHRIDKDTSGLLVIAKTDAAHRSLAAQFAQHLVERAYYAVVWGHPEPPSGRIESLIGRGRVRTRMAVVARGGKQAVTLYETQASYGRLASLVHCRLATGRTHQIRVHMSSIGHPLIGDRTYAGKRREAMAAKQGASRLVSFPRQALHAYLIGFRHPFSSETLRFSSTIPADISQLIDCLERI